MKIGILILLTVLRLAGNCQQAPTVMRLDTTLESREYWRGWVSNLLEMGVQEKNDSFFVKEEVIKTLKDSSYRKYVYPDKYKWTSAVILMRKMDLKIAFWHLINLYMVDTANRSVVMGTLMAYDSLMEIDKVILNVFYTYALADPRVCRIRNNKPDIYRPDLLEKHLNVTKEIINVIHFYRKKKSKIKD